MLNSTLFVRCTEAEAARIRGAAKYARRSTSNFLRTAAVERILGTERLRSQLEQVSENVRNRRK